MALNEGRVLAGKYRIEKLLGEGGMGAVYVATNNVLQRQVALKVMSERFASVPAAVERFHREAIAASRVSHPSIVQVFDAGEHEGKPWIAMELLEGQSLGDRLEDGPMELADVLKMATGALSALAEVHAEGIVHRDLKPDNIFLAKQRGGADFVPKVLDFGVAKDTQEGQLNKLTATGAVVGTAYYLSPEQAKGLPDIDARTDVYAMGVVLFEALSGHMPYEAETITQLIAKMFTETPRDLSEVAPHIPRPIADVVNTCLEQDRERRFQTARGLLGALEAAAAKAQDPGMAATALPTAPRRPASAVPAPRLPTPHTALSGGASAGNGTVPLGAMGHGSAPGHGSVPGSAAGHGSAPGHGSQPGYASAPGGHAGHGGPVSHPGHASPAGAPSYPGHPHGSFPATGVGMYGTAVMPAMSQPGHAPMPPSHGEPPYAVEKRGSKVGMIALVLAVFIVGAGGTAGVAFVLGGSDADPSDTVAHANGRAPETPLPSPATEPNTATVAATDVDPIAATPTAEAVPDGAEAPPPDETGGGDEAASDDTDDIEEARADTPRSGRRNRRRGREPREDPPAQATPEPAPTPTPEPTPPPRPTPARAARGLTPQQVTGTINSRLPFLQTRCYERRMRRVPGLAGVVTIGWTVGADGRVQNAEVVHNGTGDDWLARCTRNVVADTRFPAARNGAATPARYPFQFRAR